MPGEISFADETLGGAVDDVVDHGELIVGDGISVEANALVDGHQVGRGVEAGLESGSMKDGGEGCGGRALAVGSGDEHGGESFLRIAERAEQHTHVGQVELVRRSLRQFVTQGVHLRDCGLVGHGSLVAGRWSLVASR